MTAGIVKAFKAFPSLLAAASLLLVSACSKSEATQSIEQEYTVRYDVQPASVPSFDSVRLSGFVIKKRNLSGKLPVILVRTPYKIWEDEIGESKSFIDGFLAAGYAIVIQNERGRYGSGGHYTTTIPNAREDGVATLDWIVKQPWSTGRVGTFGCSSSAENQLDLALAKHPAHVAMIPRSAAVAMTQAKATNVREPAQTRRGGVFWLGGWASWFYYYGKLDTKNGKPIGDPTPPNDLDDNWADKTKGFPQTDLMKRLGVQPTEFENYIKRPINSLAWSQSRISDRDDITIPTLWMSSWFDYTPQLEIGVFEANRLRSELRHTNDHKMIVGSGMHCQQSLESKEYLAGERPVGDARLNYVERAVDWFNAFVKNDPVAKTKVTAQPAITSYDNGARRWQTADRWPVSKPGTVQLCLDARKSSLAGPSKSTACDFPVGSSSYVHYPLRPVPTTGGGGYPDDLGSGYPLGSISQDRVAKRADVKAFYSSPLEADVTTLGNVSLRLWASSDAPDIDLFATLVEVLPSGKSYNVADTALRGRYRKGYDSEIWLAAGVPAEFNMPTMVVGHTFRRGSRIGIQIASSNWPQFSINGSTKTLPELERKPRAARIQLWTGGAFPAALTLPIKPQDTTKSVASVSPSPHHSFH